MSKYENMSNKDFVEHLRTKLANSSWNVGEIVELERRGIDIVSEDQQLSKALLGKRAEFTRTVNRALEPYSKQFQILSESINSFKNLQIGSALALNPKIERELISNEKMAQDLVLREVAGTLELSLLELQGIRRQNDRDWFHWSIWATSLIAAITSVISLILN